MAKSNARDICYCNPTITWRDEIPNFLSYFAHIQRYSATHFINSCNCLSIVNQTKYVKTIHIIAKSL